MKTYPRIGGTDSFAESTIARGKDELVHALLKQRMAGGEYLNRMDLR